ncbi:MAG: T9SS type A sorting domain-containing protein [Candidatus Eisenbacteria bacterium]|uniref:T9SS type A sorting domain-containing protein n=1 Tax=Eiseniibacteriota bacterium TaxID=2212470 RepID=A0A538U7P2_UNCEI|nr:MAG: T9SS type A sorting domain-containing protein [Candidatus Eisenbacteria bacterium]
MFELWGSLPRGLREALAAAFVLLALASPARAQTPRSLSFDGVNDYVTFGQATSLGAPVFTVEIRFKRTGTGVTANTGATGVDAVPLIAKGRGEADGDTRDMNYFVGIRPTDNVLVADYEEGTGQTSPGANHPIAGATAVTSNVWHHGAVTFDGTTLRLYLDGNLENTILVGSNRLPQSASIQHASLGSALNSSGVAAGFFQGLLDEARIWNVARSQAQIQASAMSEVLSGSGLIGRWGLNEGAGATAGNSIAGSPQGTLTNGPTWSTDSSLALASATALRFGGSNGYVTFGDPAALDLPQFTLETWFRRDGVGVSTTTGSGGLADVIPLLAKGRNEGEGAAIDVNWILGIRASDGVLCADFEEGAGGASPSANHPIFGVTPIANGTWYHAAATYDGNTWQLFLNGVLETQLVVGRPVASSSTEQASIASALTSTGVAAGFWNGAIDEARVWSLARTQDQVQAAMNTEITGSATGLVARWGCNEDAGITIASSAGAINVTISGADWSWAAGAPFDAAPPSAPAAPINLSALAITQSQISLSWADVATNETSYEVERSTTGSGGPFSLLHTLPANSTSDVDGSVTSGFSYCYRVRAVNAIGPSGYAGPTCATALGPPNYALASTFDGYVDFGNPAALQLGQWTIEMWIRRDDYGFSTTTGAGGLPDAVPMVTKGRDQGDGSTVDVNYFFGIRKSDDVLAVDFEEGPGGASPGANHPLYGVTPLERAVWYHVATTYDGSTLKLYLNGQLESSLAVNRPPDTATLAPMNFMTATTTTGARDGEFVGPFDEVRIWNVARTAAQILANVNAQITTPQTGLVGRWGLDEGSGTIVDASAGTTLNGTVHNAYYQWEDGAPFTAVTNRPPLDPTLVAPGDRSTGNSTSPTLGVTVVDPEASPMTVTWYGRIISPSTAPDFTLVGLPDTQYYAAEINGATNAMLQAQTDWITNNRAALNIGYVTQYGDCVENGDNNGNPIEWQRADADFATIENPATTGLPFGVPYDIAVGNHDQTPNSDADGTTTFFNQYFGTSRFGGRPYYGGHYGANNDDHYTLFSASGMDFIVVSPEYDTSPDAAVLAWMDGVLTTYGNRRAIVVSHYVTNPGNPASWSGQGKAIYEALKGHPNLFLMLSGHIDGEGRRQDTFNGNTVQCLETDYQWHNNGGNGFLRWMQFSPANNCIRVRSYSPYLNQSIVTPDSASQFTISYDMTAGPAFQQIGKTTGVSSGTTASLPWSGLIGGRTYEWYATLDDGATLIRGPFWRFTTTGTVGVPDGRPGAFELEPIRPNPTEGGGQIAFTVPTRSTLRLAVFDLQGREVARLAEGEHDPGRYSVDWDAKAHARLQTGIYFVRLDAPGAHLTRRLVLMR